jgi:tetratricopeptide (TPR) repeat protein
MDEINTISETISDLRKQLRISTRINVFLMVVLCILLIFYAMIWTGYFTKANRQSWYDVVYDMDAGSYDKALATALKLLERTRGDWYGHSSVARVYLVKCDYSNAEKHYKIAYNLFPTKENEDNLLAVRKLMNRSENKERK